MIGVQPTRSRGSEMAQSRGIVLGSIMACLVLGMSPATAQKKYDPGASDSEIKLGNIMPYSGPLSAYALIGRTQDAFFRGSTLKAASNGGRLASSSYATILTPPKKSNRRGSWGRATREC